MESCFPLGVLDGFKRDAVQRLSPLFKSRKSLNNFAFRLATNVQRIPMSTHIVLRRNRVARSLGDEVVTQS